MATLVGTQTDLTDALQSLIELNYDAVEAYQAAINRLKNKDYRLKLEEFCADHRRNMDELSSLLEKRHIEPKSIVNAKQWLTKGKVFLANMIGDDAILKAMLSNEEDTYRAYHRMNERDDISWDGLKAILESGLASEEKHKGWLKETVG